MCCAHSNTGWFLPKRRLCFFQQKHIFSRTAFECVADQQKKRTCKTIKQGDKCNVVKSLADGRPKNATDFN
jgi:hypothetical protein